MNIEEYTAKELRKLRAEKNVSQQEVAKIVNINVGTIVRYENATTSISIDRLEKLLNYYNVNLGDFFKCY